MSELKQVRRDKGFVGGHLLSVHEHLHSVVVRRGESVVGEHKRGFAVRYAEIRRHQLIAEVQPQIVVYAYLSVGQQSGVERQAVFDEIRLVEIFGLAFLQPVFVAVLLIVVLHRQRGQPVSRALSHYALGIQQIAVELCAPGQFAVGECVLAFRQQFGVLLGIPVHHSPFVVVSHQEIVVQTEAVFEFVGHFGQNFGGSHHYDEVLGHHIGNGFDDAFHAEVVHAGVPFAPQAYHSELYGVDGFVEQGAVRFDEGFDLFAMPLDIRRPRSRLALGSPFVGEAEQHFNPVRADESEIFAQLHERAVGYVAVCVVNEINVNLHNLYAVLCVKFHLACQSVRVTFTASGESLVGAEPDVRLAPEASAPVVGGGGGDVAERYAVVGRHGVGVAHGGIVLDVYFVAGRERQTKASRNQDCRDKR